MAITKQKLRDDVILQLTQSAPSDDLELENVQVEHWIQYHLHDLQKREIVAELKAGRMIPPIYTIRETGLTINEETTTDVDDSKQRMWVNLTNDVLDLPNDAGLVQVRDYDGNMVFKASLENLYILNNLRFAKSSSNNLVHFRQGKKVFIEGLKTSELRYTSLIVDYIKKQDILALSDSDEVIISDQLIPMLIDLCVERGIHELYGTEPDQENDGVDVKKLQYHTAIGAPTTQPPPNQ